MACSFWLAECYARQGRMEEAREVFDRSVSTGNELVLFSEEYDPKTGQMLGNFPQALTHLSHISAATGLVVTRDDSYQEGVSWVSSQGKIISFRESIRLNVPHTTRRPGVLLIAVVGAEHPPEPPAWRPLSLALLLDADRPSG